MISISFLILLFLFMIPSVQAYDGIFKILDERYVEAASDLPESKNLKPDMNIQSSGHINSWIDIVGFRDMIREDSIDYVSGSPIDHAIVQGDAWSDFSGGDCNPFSVRHCYQDSIDKKFSISSNESHIIARMDVILKYHKMFVRCGGMSCWWETTYHIETATFQDIELAPKQYPALNELKVILTQYNNTLYENVGIKTFGDNYSKISFKYHDKQAVRTSKILHVENNPKGIFYGNVTELNQWKIEGTNISRFYNEILLDGNLSEMDINQFDIRIYNPFTSRRADPENFTIERAEFAPQKTISSLLIAVTGIFSTLIIGTLYLFNRTVYRWNIRLF